MTASASNRERLEPTRSSITHKIVIHAQPETIEGFLIVGLYPDGRPGEIFLSMRTADEGMQGMAKCFCTAISLCLQCGLPIEHITRKFAHWRFPPEGYTGNPDIPFAKSLADYIARWLELTFCAERRESDAAQLTSPGDVSPVGPFSSAVTSYSNRSLPPALVEINNRREKRRNKRPGAGKEPHA